MWKYNLLYFFVQDGGYHIFKGWDEALIEEIRDLRFSIDKQADCMRFIGHSEADDCISEHLSRIEAELGELKEVKRVLPFDLKDTFLGFGLKNVSVVVIILGLISYILLIS